MLPGENTYRKLISSRYVLAYLAFFGFCVVYMLRVNLSVALIAMVKDTGKTSTKESECPSSSNTASNSSQEHSSGPQYEWDRNLQGVILGSFFYGYIVTQIPGGWLAGKYGGKLLFGCGVLCTSVLTLVTPLAAEWSAAALIVVRVLEGLGEGVTFPAMHAIWAEWAPPLERSKLATLSYAGAQFGTVIGLPLSGVVTSKLGWVWVFYIFGALGCLWFVVWMLIVSDRPAKHKRISTEELLYITTEISKTKDNSEPITLANTPWIEMAKSPAVWATSVAHFSHNWGFYTLLTCLPTFMSDVLQFDLSNDSFLSSLPYIFMWLAVWLSGFVVDTAREKHILSTGAARKTALTVGLLVPAVCLIATGYVGCDYSLAVVLLCVAGTFDGISQSGYNVNHLDIAPKYAGTLMGITNTLATIPGFLGPQVVGWLTAEASTSKQWRSIFYISAEIYVFGVIIFDVLGSGEVQPWAIRQQKCSDERTALLDDDSDNRRTQINHGNHSDCK